MNFLRPRPLLRPFSARYSSTSNTHDIESLGLSARVVERLRTAFPHITTPSRCQTGLIPAILSPNSRGVYRDVFLKSDTGTGKSFGLALALLSKPTLVRRKTGDSLRLTNLVVVPHRELAYQYLHWISSLFPDEYKQLAHLCIRGDPQHPLPTQIVKGTPESSLRPATMVHPSILIATPQALSDLMKASPDPSGPFSASKLMLNLSTVAVDEVDGMLALPARDAPRREVEAWNRHIPIVSQILDGIYEERTDKKKTPRPQLVLASATLGAQVRRHVFSKTRWLRKPVDETLTLQENDMVVRLEYSKTTESEPESPAIVQHSCVVVNEDGETRNMEFSDAEESKTSSQPLTTADKKRLKAEHDKLKATPAVSKPSSHLVQALATTFAVDVPALALLVIPSSYNVKLLVAELQELGVNAQPVDSSSDYSTHNPPPSDNPTLLISTLATTRGLDFPSLTHVFLLGTDAIKTPTDYVHVSGRVGRFSRGGKVIAFIEGEIAEGRMNRLYKKLDIVPTAVELDVDYPEEL